MTHFCEPFPTTSPPNVPTALNETIRSWHLSNCAQYHDFIRRNADAAWSTRNSKGVVGTWWGAPQNPSPSDRFETILDPGATDSRNGGEPVSLQLNTTEGDLNDRGRGRTVESHSGGVAAMGALLRVVEWE